MQNTQIARSWCGRRKKISRGVGGAEPLIFLFIHTPRGLPLLQIVIKIVRANLL